MTTVLDLKERWEQGPQKRSAQRDLEKPRDGKVSTLGLEKSRATENEKREIELGGRKKDLLRS